MKNFKKICSGKNLVGCLRQPTRLGWLKKIGTATIFLFIFLYFTSLALAIPAERDNFIILGREGKDNEGKSVLMEEQIVLRTAPNINSQEQGRLDSGVSVRVIDITQIETETFYLVMKVGKGGGLSGWVSEDYIYEITTEPQGE